LAQASGLEKQHLLGCGPHMTRHSSSQVVGTEESGDTSTSDRDAQVEHESSWRRFGRISTVMLTLLAMVFVAGPLIVLGQSDGGLNMMELSTGHNSFNSAGHHNSKLSALHGIVQAVGMGEHIKAPETLVPKKPGYNVTKNYYNSGFLNLPNFSAKNNPGAWPSLFCWLLMQTVDENPMGWMEEKLVKHQLVHGIGIFDCNDWAVMTSFAVALNRWGPRGFPRIHGKPNPWVDMASWSIGDTQAVKGVETNPLNSVVFRNAWMALRTSKKLEKHEWVVKVDPDAVWFPDRLRNHLKTYMPGHGAGTDNVFLKNCPRFQTMQGPIEVISRQAALTVEAEIQTCHGVYGTGEDQYIVKCMEMLGISGQMEPTLLNDLYCDGYTNCNEPWKVAFHPHKKLLDFGTCYNMSLQASKLQPAR